MSARDDLVGRAPKMRPLERHDPGAARAFAREVHGDRAIVLVPRMATTSGPFTRCPVSLPAAPWEVSS